jgi:hypothetical protein
MQLVSETLQAGRVCPVFVKCRGGRNRTAPSKNKQATPRRGLFSDSENLSSATSRRAFFNPSAYTKKGPDFATFIAMFLRFCRQIVGFSERVFWVSHYFSHRFDALGHRLFPFRNSL